MHAGGRMGAPDAVLELVERFERNRAQYLNPAYNETQVRREFLDPLFTALGWDVDNRAGYAQQYKDVVHEDAIKVGLDARAPDYSFRIGGQRKFFVEAKKPAVNLKDDPAPAFQLRRYAWSAKLPLSLLTDFQELAVYDCRVKPAAGDKPSVARTLYVPCESYAERWDEIAGVFGKEAILQGSFDRYAESTKAKKGTAEVDKAFLGEIELWRDALARNLALRNPALSQRELNYAVQVTIDRIIFLRICEDRGIEVYGRLQALCNGGGTYGRLRQLFFEADQRYNSGLFHFEDEKGRSGYADRLTPGIAIDDKVLKDILRRLYYPESPYEFSVLPADILGQVYEQFLGKVIRLTAGHQAKVEDKPEVKKAGGVYYTPTYIVDYIVKNTVGRLLEGLAPKQAAELRILDPACGSGSFLIGAYQYLLDWHLTAYAEHPEKHRKELVQGRGGEWQLATAEKKRILQANIYGVDIDAQAVETTKLSLLLKVLEGESSESLDAQLSFLRERALPDLAANIKCGNSLIGPDFYDDQQLGLAGLDEEERYRINVFDWEAEFPEMLGKAVPEDRRGFDAVIGNPPYVDIKGMPAADAKYLFGHFPSANNRINLFACFIERSLDLANRKSGRFSMIVPTAVLSQVSYEALRRRILSRSVVTNVVRPPNEIFGSAAGDVKVDTVVLVVDAAAPSEGHVDVTAYSGYERITAIDEASADLHVQIPLDVWRSSPEAVWSLRVDKGTAAILEKCERDSVPLDACADFCLGLTPYDKYRGHTPEQIHEKAFHADYRKDETFKPLLAGNDVERYWVHWNGRQWISYGPWLGAAREQRFFTEKRILVKQIIDWSDRRPWAAMTEEELYNTQNAFTVLPRSGWSCAFVLGLLNSRLIAFYHRRRFLEEFKMRFQKVLIKDFRRLPLPASAAAGGQSEALAAQIASAAETMTSLRRRVHQCHMDDDARRLEREAAALDRRIDGLVYEIYGLTDDEIALVEAT
jgi:type I restriction-modification system DNA methylase subunit